MLIAYVDESGDTGDHNLKGSSDCYALGCVLVDALDWSSAFDATIAMRQRMRDTYGIRTRDEIKASYLIRGVGPLKSLGLSTSARQQIYRAHLRVPERVHTRAFAVVIDKTSPRMQGRDIFDVAWLTLMQRLERTSTKEEVPFMIVHDQGEDGAVRRLTRKSRRYLVAGSMFGTGFLDKPARWLVDDPSPRDSKDNYFIQLADLIAYAGWRSVWPPSKSVAQVVPQDTWDVLGAARLDAVNMYSGGPAGVVFRQR